ncbi:hypothetical protein [Aurantimonas marina]|uniref:hypothetical protein n=1 Tax=Aurantimonas marina TaxID=2780508 RepID=UPI0019D1D67F|nr:hypothetical protein [Aurantimonas marina]
MSEIGDTVPDNLASHTLAHLRRMDGVEKTMIPMIDLLSRHAMKAERSDRDNRESFARIERDLGEIKSDAIISENKSLDRLNEALALSRRIDKHEERLDNIEKPLSSPHS